LLAEYTASPGIPQEAAIEAIAAAQRLLEAEQGSGPGSSPLQGQ